MKRLVAFCIVVMATVDVLLIEFPAIYTPSTETRIDKPKSPRPLINDTYASDVLIVTYMRSGSSFLGRILGWRKDTFYWYEPLWKLHTWQFLREDGTHCHYYKQQCNNNLTDSNKKKEKAIEFLKDVYQCKLNSHSSFVADTIHTGFDYTGPSWDSFRKCTKENHTIENCLTKMQSVCRSANHKVTKVLRLDMIYADQLLRFNPRLKVILLLRDPRGILNSHLHSDWFPINLTNLKVFEDDVIVTCSRMTRDVKAAHLLLKRFEDRVKIVQYEDLSLDHKKAKLLNKFLGMSNSQSVAFKIPTTEQDPFSYKERLASNILTIIDNHCGDLYNKLGLVHFKDLKHIRNRTVPSMRDKLLSALHR